MIGTMLVSVMLSAAAQNAAIGSSRTALITCVREAAAQAKVQKIAADAYEAFAHQQCAAAEAKLKASLWAFDQKNKVSKRQSEADAQMQIDDVIATSAERYAMALQDAAPK